MPRRTGEYAKCQKLCGEHPDWPPLKIAEVLGVSLETAQNAKREWRRRQKPANQAPETIELDDADIFATNLESFVAHYRLLRSENERLASEVQRWRLMAGKLNEDITKLIGSN